MPGRHRRGRGWGSVSPASGLRRFLEPCLLLLLEAQPSHGYDLARALADYGMADIDASLVYRALRGLEAAGMVLSEWENAASGPSRRIYCLSPAGRVYLTEWHEQLRKTDLVLHRFLESYARQMGRTHQ